MRLVWQGTGKQIFSVYRWFAYRSPLSGTKNIMPTARSTSFIIFPFVFFVFFVVKLELLGSLWQTCKIQGSVIYKK